MSDLESILPPNVCGIERDFEQLFRRLKGLAVPIELLWNPDLCPAELLSYLAWAVSIEEWDPEWSDTTKRSTIKNSVAVHRIKGSVKSVKDALKFAGYGDAQVVERFGWQFYDASVNHDGEIDHSTQDHWAEYRVILTRPITIEQAAQVRAILRDIAPVRSHLKALDFTQALNTYNARISHDGQFTHGVA